MVYDIASEFPVRVGVSCCLDDRIRLGSMATRLAIPFSLSVKSSQLTPKFFHNGGKTKIKEMGDKIV